MYLRLKDYDRLIQNDNLTQIISQDSSIRLLSEQMAIEEACSYLRPKYDIVEEFNDTEQFLMSSTYSVDSRINLEGYEYYNNANSYVVDDIVFANNEQVYVCNTPTTGVFDANDWDLIGNKSDLFYVKAPYPMFNYRTGIYKIGDQVTFRDKVYTALKPSPQLTHTDLLNALTYANLPPTNILPDDPTYGASYWGVGIPYVITGVLPTDTDVWTKGDNRSQQMVMVVIDITLYHIHSRIAPRNIPELRMIRYESAKEWLNKCNLGELSPDLPLLPIQNFNRIRWGGNTKTTNIY
jgi:hypothetical protein